MPEVKPKAWQTATRFFILAGLILVVGGFAMFLILDPASWLKNPWVSAPVGLGIVLAIVGVLVNLSWLGDIFLRRRALVGVNVVFMTLIAIIVVIFLNFISLRRYARWDLTESSRFSLSGKTVNVLSGLKERVEVTALVGGVRELDAWLQSRIEDLLEEYKARSTKLEVEVIEATRERDRVKLFLDGIGEKDAELNSLIVRCRGRTKHVTQKELIKFTPRPLFNGEAALTEAIINVSEGKPPVVYFSTGHGERSIQDGLSRLNTYLKRDNYETKTISLAVDKRVPEDCDILVIAGPKTLITQEEIGLIRNYLQGGGKLLAMLEPAAARGEASSLARLLREFNVDVRGDLVAFDRSTNIFGQTILTHELSARDFAPHAITDSLSNINLRFFGAAPLKVIESGSSQPGMPPAGNPAYRAIALVRARKSSWGESQPMKREKRKYEPAEDEEGPVVLAAAVEVVRPGGSAYAPPEPVPGGARLIIIGDVDCADNRLIDSLASANKPFIINAFNWLAEKSTLLGIGPQEPDLRPLRLTPKSQRAVFWISIVGMPFAAILVGGVVWWRRRR